MPDKRERFSSILCMNSKQTTDYFSCVSSASDISELEGWLSVHSICSVLILIDC